MNKKLIVSSADSNYFELLNELFLSLKNNNILAEYDFAILDTGLTEDQINYFNDFNVYIKKAIWNVKVPRYKIRSRDHLKTQVARAFLPDYFPNYKIYVWLDADVWINNVDTFLLYEKGAMKDRLCITPQIDRSYGPSAKVEWFYSFPKKIKTINYKNIGRSISYSLARKYAMHPTLNAGAFAISDNIDIWSVIQKNISIAAKKGRIFGTDQVALALSVYKEKLPVEFLPAYTNWMCDFHLPLFDKVNNQFIEPYLPHHPIGLIHLAGLDSIRKNKNELTEIINLNNEKEFLSLRYQINNK